MHATLVCHHSAVWYFKHLMTFTSNNIKRRKIKMPKTDILTEYTRG